jgi:hypothetical protein
MAQTSSRGTKRKQVAATIDGLQGFLKDMGVLPAQMQRAEKVFQTIAAATVYATAKQMAIEEGPQQVLFGQTLRQTGNGTVTYGGMPGAMGAEFGAIIYAQFPEWRGNKEDAGYFFWPAIREFRDEDMINLWARQVWEVVKDLFSG